MRWLKYKLRQWLNDEVLATTSLNRTIEFSSALRFSVQSASGGTVIEVNTYDSKKDQYGSNLHVIPDGEDISECIGEIVMIEMLKRS